jgi:DNA-3-methyladenine glycosylase
MTEGPEAHPGHDARPGGDAHRSRDAGNGGDAGPQREAGPRRDASTQEPRPPVSGASEREGSPQPETVPAAVHTPPSPETPPATRSLPPRVSDQLPPSASDPLPPGAFEPLPVEFYLRPLLEVTRDLLGRLLVHRVPEGTSAVRLVETEAYDGPGLDPASHAHRGPTRRNTVMFGPPGHLYLYFTYGMHWCANVVCGPEGIAQAVLLRAGEPVRGEELMAARRPASRPRDLARGPARLCQALGLAGWANGAGLTSGPVLLTAGWPVPDDQVTWTGRVGVVAAADRPWRALVTGHPSVSPGRPGPARRPRGAT